GLGFAVKLDKPDFIGKAALLAQGEPQRIRVGLRVTGRGVIREHEPIALGGTEIGITTSGTHCPYLGVSCAMAYIDKAHSTPGTAVEVTVRGRAVSAEVVTLPFYKRA
ncbi:MAG: glycine cleavage T C-terminal barrel domain-containing protein, partial [Angelakisella sp.]